MKNLTEIARIKLSSLAFAALVGVSLQACFIIPDGEDIEITDDSCVAYCEEVNDCGTLQRNCQAVCDLWETMDCDAEVNTFDECKSEGDVCGENPQCDDEADAAFACFEDYCVENPGEGACPDEPNQ